MRLSITDLQAIDEPAIEQAAAILVAAFAQHWPDAWPTQDDALEEIYDLLEGDYILRIARGEQGRVLGWVGGQPEYDGRVWELHPLAVHPEFQRQGVGQALVRDLEAQVAARGGLTIMLGSDDVSAMTSLADEDLYDNLLLRIATIRNFKAHPYSFYEKMGYQIVGVIPDANGYGKPDILMAKRVGQA